MEYVRLCLWTMIVRRKKEIQRFGDKRFISQSITLCKMMEKKYVALLAISVHNFIKLLLVKFRSILNPFLAIL